MRLLLFSLALGLLVCGCNNPPDSASPEEQQAVRERRDKWFQASDGKNVREPESITAEMIESLPHKPKQTPPENPYPIYSNSAPGVNPEGAPPLPVKLDSKEKIKVELNFNAAAFADVVAVIADLLQFNYQIEGSLPGTVTLTLREQLTREELWNVFRQIASGVEAHITASANVIILRPPETIPHSVAVPGCRTDIQLGVFPLKNIGVKETTPQLTPFLSKNVKPIELESRNLLLIVDTPDALARIRRILAELDQPQRRHWAKMVIPCRNISAARLVQEIGEILPILGFPVALNSDKPKTEEIQISAIDRLQVIVASAAGREALEELGRWINILDQVDVGDQERLFIYNILNGKAEELIKALSVMFPVEGETLSAGKDAGSGASIQSPGGKNAAASTAFSSGKRISAQNTRNAPASVFDVPVKVFADAVNNRLLLRTTPRAYAMVKALLGRLDTIPPQVLLQVLVVDVSLNDSVQFGVEFMMKGGKNNVEAIGGTNYSGLVPGAGQDSQSGGKFWLFNPNNPEEKFGYINALAGKTNIKVVSSPQVLISSHKEAKLSVGSKVPVVNSEITNTQSIIAGQDDSTTNLIRNIQYLDTGVILKITPHVTRGGRIALEISQTVSEADSNKTSDIDSPVIKEQIIETSMSIRDGQTIICGGLIKEKKSDNLSTLPIIGGIPFIRRLIGDTNVSTERTEMLILISGAIISEKTKLENLLERYNESVRSLIEFHAPPEVRKKKIEQNKGLLETWFIE